ncbi:MAG: hypothetical protein R3C28_17270 [Pirellulaceae bacterium]
MNRLVVLGASNIARNFCNIARIARSFNSGPLDMQLAFGHGRSYELRTTVLVRQLPGINHCGIWSNLETSPVESTYSLVTDIGNDILYGRSIQQIIESVRTSVVRLQAFSQRIVITRPPMHAIRKLDSLRFVTMRSLLFPGCRLSLSQTVDLADDLDQQILKLAAEQNLVVLEPLEHWFGLDPIHIQLWHSQAAWQSILNCVFAKDDAAAAAGRCQMAVTITPSSRNFD